MSDYKQRRIDLKLNLDDVSELSGFAVGTISDLENHDRGGKRLREKLDEIYGNISGFELRDKSSESEVLLWRRRAKTAEAELAKLRAGLRALLEEVTSSAKIDRLAHELGNAVVDTHDTEHKPSRG